MNRDDVIRMAREAGFETASEWESHPDGFVRVVVRFAALAYAAGEKAQRQPLTDEQIEKGRVQTFSVNNPYCPCDSKTMRKAVRWAEASHGIGAKP